jgi:hypothetical protein
MGFRSKEYPFGIEALVIFLRILFGIATPVYAWRLIVLKRIIKKYELQVNIA